MTIIGLFVIIQLAAFIIYASFYASSMQDIATRKKLLRHKTITSQPIIKSIQSKLKKVKFYKRLSLLTIIALTILHVVFLYIHNNFTFMNVFWAVVIGSGTTILWLIINWLKGAGTIDDNARLPGFTRI